MELLLQLFLIGAFIAFATVICMSYQRVALWWHFRTRDKPKSQTNWPLVVMVFGFPVITGAAIIIRNW